MPPPSSLPVEPSRIDPLIWRACAGTSGDVPTVHSRVYYFAQGHAEQSTSAPTLSPFALAKPFVLCQISAVDFLADPLTDEVFVKLSLVPLNTRSNSPVVESNIDSQVVLTQESGTERGVVRDDNDDEILSFAKILTPSDANNGGGFSVPRFYADSIFPPLDFQADTPVQTLTFTDVHGTRWDFRHIFRGTPRRHLLTTGWSKFVNRKKLIAGDSVVLIRNSQGHLFVGVRRAVRFQSADCSRWREQIGGVGGVRVRGKLEEEGFSGSGRERVPPEAVTQAAERAAQGFPFEVLYYPKMGSADFVVRAEAVEASLNVCWTPGMRVKIAMETENSSKMTWFQGTVSVASVPERSPWHGSPWRMLQVTWDGSEVLQNAKRVSPWRVEIAAASLSLHVAFPFTKKIRLHENSGLLTDGDGELFVPITGSPISTTTSIDASLLNYNPLPVGMQGARQDTFRFSDQLNGYAPQMCTDNIYGNNVVPKLKSVSTELSTGSSESENLSPDSQSSIQSFGTEEIGNQDRSSTKVGVTSFQLFGKVIQMNQPIANGFEKDGYSESACCKRLDVQCRGATACGACPL